MLGILAVIVDVLWGTALPSSLCRVMPVALLCGQLVSILVAKALGPGKDGDGQQTQAVMEEKH